MTSTHTTISLMVFCVGAALSGGSGHAAAAKPTHTLGTAHTIGAGRTSVGLFQPLRFGVSEAVEVSTHPATNVLIPNLALKVRWGTWGGFVVCTRHHLTYPTGLLTVLAREGTGGLLPAATRLPHIVGVSNTIFLTRSVGTDRWITLKAALPLAARFGQSTLRSIDLPILFPRLAAYHKGWSFVFGCDFDGAFTRRLGFSVDVDVFVLPYERARYALEHSAMLVWGGSESVSVFAGYKAVYGRYPYGAAAWNLGGAWYPFPMVDVQWSW